MTPERWQQVESIAAAAIDRAADERAAFLADACADDVALRREVESLLGFETAAESFLQQTAMEEAARLVASDADRLTGELATEGYDILELLGSGGMGDVYRARDRRLERDVALKIVHAVSHDTPSAKVEEEARTASSLSHPNIVTIHAVGSRKDIAFIVMELVTGRTLRELLADGPLTLDVAVDIALQLAEALGAAHTAGVVHRDLKPDNVMVTPDGLVKVLDFGIAKRERGFSRTVVQGARGSSARTAAHSTLAGTAGYMSPEQAAGRLVDYRSDQFSFGAILYEMLAGRRAFERETKSETLDAVIAADIAPLLDVAPSVPRTLAQVVDRCLSKDPDHRYLNKRDPAIEIRRIRDELLHERMPRPVTRRRAIILGGAAILSAAGGLAIWRLGTGASTVRRLAVLPLQHPAGDENTEILSDGITEMLIWQLGRVTDHLAVIGRSIVLRFKGQPQDALEIGRQLDADLVLTGSVERRGERAVVKMELVDAATGVHIWGGPFDRSEADVLAIQSEIASTILREIIGTEVSSRQQQQLAQVLPTDAQAFSLFLSAIHYFRLDTESDYLTARNLLRQTVALDRTFALGHLTLASTYSVMAVDGFELPHDAWRSSSEHVTRALEQDPDLPDAHAERASEAFFYRWDWAGARREWNIALTRRAEIQPEIMTSYAIQLWALGQTAEALRFARAARAIDRLSPMLAIREADMLAYSGDLPSAEALYLKVIDDRPGDPRAYFGLAEVRRLQERFDDAIAASRQAFLALEDDSADDVLSGAHGRDGYRRLERYLASRELAALDTRAEAGLYASPLDRARAHARLGDTDRAFDLLEDAFDDKASGLALLNVDRAWDTVRRDPRLASAITRVGLPS